MALGTIIANFVLNGFMNQLLSIIVSLGIILHLFLVCLNYPVDLLNFFGLLFPLITFDVFPVSSLYEKWFHFAEITTDHAISDQYNIVGYGSIFVISNIGSLFLFLILQLLLLPVLWLSRRYKPFKCMKVLQGKIDSLADNTIWTGTINLFVSNYLVLCVVSFIESNDLRFGRRFSHTENFCSLLACFGIAFSVALPTILVLLF